METKNAMEIEKIQASVVGMYSENPWPLNRNAEEEMGWRLKCLGISSDNYKGKSILRKTWNLGTLLTKLTKYI